MKGKTTEHLNQQGVKGHPSSWITLCKLTSKAVKVKLEIPHQLQLTT